MHKDVYKKKKTKRNKQQNIQNMYVGSFIILYILFLYKYYCNCVLCIMIFLLLKSVFRMRCSELYRCFNTTIKRIRTKNESLKILGNTYERYQIRTKLFVMFFYTNL